MSKAKIFDEVCREFDAVWDAKGCIKDVAARHLKAWQEYNLEMKDEEEKWGNINPHLKGDK